MFRYITGWYNKRRTKSWRPSSLLAISCTVRLYNVEWEFVWRVVSVNDIVLTSRNHSSYNMEHAKPSLGSGPWFRPSLSRSTSCVVIRFKESGSVVLVVSLSTRWAFSDQFLRLGSDYKIWPCMKRCFRLNPSPIQVRHTGPQYWPWKRSSTLQRKGGCWYVSFWGSFICPS